ncbi:MAG: hypothetical protein O3C40_11740 [Planctomycetota bacterium]|nr:hypothetical protein [Planctomycetota bacterium]
MQLDSTRIAIRERNLLDTFDLALHVLREYFKPLLITFFVAVIPLLVLNDLLIGWMLDVEYRETFFYLEEQGSIWRFWWDMTCLVFIEAPLASIFMTSFLGQAVFVAEPSYREVFRDVGKMWKRVVWCQLLVRAVLPACLVFLLVERYDGFNVPVELLLLGSIATYAAFVRAIRPFINEIVLLERNPLTSRNPSAITIGKRSKDLHGPSGGDLFARWLATAMFGMLLTVCVGGTFLFCSGVFLNDWQPGPTMLRYMYPLAMWVVAGYLAVVRFLSYLDLRIRHEGWEVELRLRAEAARQAAKLI